MNLKDSQDGYMGTFGGRKRKGGNNVIIIQKCKHWQRSGNLHLYWKRIMEQRLERYEKAAM